VHEIFTRYTDLIEPLSLDEAYLDVTHDKLQIGSAITIAEEIRKAIKEELQLTASAGVSINKFVAKIASDMKKPDGLTFIGPSRIAHFMETLPVEKFHGVGKVTAAKMKSMQLFTGADLKKLDKKTLVQHFGKSGIFFYQIVRGIDDRPVQASRETKSVGAEDTFPEDLIEQADLEKELDRISVLVAKRLGRHDLKGRTVSLKIKYNDFRIITRSRSDITAHADAERIAVVAKELLVTTLPAPKGIRLLGVSMSNFESMKPVTSAGQKGPQLKLDL
jgi:DNA polymerase-4